MKKITFVCTLRSNNYLSFCSDSDYFYKKLPAIDRASIEKIMTNYYYYGLFCTVFTQNVNLEIFPIKYFYDDHKINDSFFNYT